MMEQYVQCLYLTKSVFSYSRWPKRSARRPRATFPLPMGLLKWVTMDQLLEELVVDVT